MTSGPDVMEAESEYAETETGRHCCQNNAHGDGDDGRIVARSQRYSQAESAQS